MSSGVLDSLIGQNRFLPPFILDDLEAEMRQGLPLERERAYKKLEIGRRSIVCEVWEQGGVPPSISLNSLGEPLFEPQRFVQQGSSSGPAQMVCQDLANVASSSVAAANNPELAQLKIAPQPINQFYVLEERKEVEEFIRVNRLLHLLEQALKPLNEFFGEAPIKTLRLVMDDESSQTLFCLVRVKETAEKARDSRLLFDREWWLDHCASVRGKLNFDYELV